MSDEAAAAEAALNVRLWARHVDRAERSRPRSWSSSAAEEERVQTGEHQRTRAHLLRQGLRDQRLLPPLWTFFVVVKQLALFVHFSCAYENV